MKRSRSAVSWCVAGLLVAGTSCAVLCGSIRRMTIAVNSVRGQSVGRVQEVICETSSGWPVIVVRDVSAGSVWWVQEHDRARSGNQFAAVAHFGNENTPTGTPFQIVVLSLPNAAAASKFAVGATLKDLPADVAHSEPVDVIRR